MGRVWVAVLGVVLFACGDAARPSEDGLSPPASAAGDGDRSASGQGALPVAPDAAPSRAEPPEENDAQVDGLAEPALRHSFEPVTVDASAERKDLCQSWTLDNDEPLWVNVVRARNEGAVHHSNWIWVPDSEYAGPDGTWLCAERGFDQIIAGAIGGVFFAQSTQSRRDEQRFPEGVAFQMPPRARIIGDVHLLNATEAPVEPASTSSCSPCRPRR